MFDHLVIGSLNADYLFKVHTLPRSGQTMHSYDFLPMLGGKGGNQAAAIARLGGKVAMLGRVGSDSNGPRSIENLKSQGVETGLISTDPAAPTGTAMGIVADNGENIIVVSSGANGQVSKADIDKAETFFASVRFILLQLEIPIETVLYAIEKAAPYPCQIILNPAPAYALPDNCLARVDYLVPNESEASLLSGVEISDMPTAAKAAHVLVSRGAQRVIITLGEHGALLATPHGNCHFPAVPVKAVDPTSCGDAFIGGLAVSLATGRPVEKAIEYANTAGAVTVTRFGAQPSLAWAKETDELYQKHYGNQ